MDLIQPRMEALQRAGTKRGDMQLHPTSRHQHRARDIAGLPPHPVDPFAR
jgi:hypothetical protein